MRLAQYREAVDALIGVFEQDEASALADQTRYAASDLPELAVWSRGRAAMARQAQQAVRVAFDVRRDEIDAFNAASDGLVEVISATLAAAVNEPDGPTPLPACEATG